MKNKVLLPLESPLADLQIAGGKGANLAHLVRAGLPVPQGFIITTPAYRQFIATNGLEAHITALLAGAENAKADELEALSTQLRALFDPTRLPTSLAQAVMRAYHALGQPPVAVRSSATAEDLPEMSFAGQQDTYLNVVGEKALQEAIVYCWSSLWTARAIGYRQRNHIPHAEVALAVVVQCMVESQVSGVLFTANPLSGLRSETVMDATLGLGEALVSGRVEPDHYVVDMTQGRIVSKTLGAKRLSLHGEQSGGMCAMEADRSQIQALPDDAILELAQLGRQVDALYPFPQDIEWAWQNGKFYLLQARPITALFPLPENLPTEPLKVLFSFGAVQGMLEPMTPIGRDAICGIVAAASSLFRIHVTAETQRVLYTAGERLWANITTLIRNSFGRKAAQTALGLVEPSVRQAFEQVMDDPRLQPDRPGISLHAGIQLAHFFLPLAGKILLNLLAPRRRRRLIVENGEHFLENIRQVAKGIDGDAWQKLAQRVELFPEQIQNNLGHIFLLFVSGVASGMASWNVLNTLAFRKKEQLSAEEKQKRRDLIMQVTRGMPNNPTTEMDLTLWQMAKRIRQDAEASRLFHEQSAAQCAAQYQAETLPPVAMEAVRTFLMRYGGRGFGEIDLGRTRWADDPTHVFEMLSSFLRIEDENSAPDVIFARSAQSAEAAVTKITDLVRLERGGWWRSHLVRFFAGRARLLMGLRESPKFFAVRMMSVIQHALLQSGRELMQMGELEQPDDLFFLTFLELRRFAARQEGDWHSLIRQRKASYQREFQRRQIPRLLLSDGRAFYEGMATPQGAEGVVMGSPVSPGVVEGHVRVVLNPSQAHLQPGEILVCPGTDPSWTPLFLSAGGLVMETGGMMTHGAVVAREYGIPAIVGVDRATLRFHTGQRIRVNGSNGQIHLLDSKDAAAQ